MNLSRKTCVPCREGAPKLEGLLLASYIRAVNPAWQLFDGSTKLKRVFVFEDFRQAVDFTNRVADIAEQEGHHPNMYIYAYNKVRIELWTHKIGGLHENDFILAAKIDALKP